WIVDWVGGRAGGGAGAGVRGGAQPPAAEQSRGRAPLAPAAPPLKAWRRRGVPTFPPAAAGPLIHTLPCSVPVPCGPILRVAFSSLQPSAGRQLDRAQERLSSALKPPSERLDRRACCLLRRREDDAQQRDRD